MLKYDHQLTEVKTRLPGANRILIVLAQNLNTDNLAAGLSLYLSMKAAGKKVDIVSTGTPLVSQSNLYGIGEIKNDIPKSGAGNYIISLDGVVDNTGTMQQVPALEKLDWYPEGSKLNLVFHVVPGQRFEPTNVTTSHEQSGYDLTWIIGCQSLNELGNLFISNSQYFAQSQVINVDVNPLNSYFGFANVIDPQASSISEILAHILPSLTLNQDRDVASNIIAGIYSATNNLTQKVNPDTFLAVSQAVQAGGSLSPVSAASSPVSEPATDYRSQSDSQVIQPVQISQPQQSEPFNPPQVIQPIQPEPQPVVQTQTFDAQPQPQFSQPDIQQPQPIPAPQPSLQSSPFIVPPQDITIPIPPPSAPEIQPQPQYQMNIPPVNPIADPSVQQVTGIPQGQSQGFDLRQIFQIPQMASGAVPANTAPNQPVQPQIIDQPVQPQSVGGKREAYYEQPPQAQASPEERPMGEFATSPSPDIESTPTPDWLVPKIFKGGNLG